MQASDFSVLSGVIILIIILTLMHMYKFHLIQQIHFLSVHFHIPHICAICLTFCSLCRCSWLSPTWSSERRNKARVEQNEKGREKRTQSTSIPTGTERGERKGRNVVRAKVLCTCGKRDKSNTFASLQQDIFYLNMDIKTRIENNLLSAELRCLF